MSVQECDEWTQPLLNSTVTEFEIQKEREGRFEKVVHLKKEEGSEQLTQDFLQKRTKIEHF